MKKVFLSIAISCTFLVGCGKEAQLNNEKINENLEVTSIEVQEEKELSKKILEETFNFNNNNYEESKSSSVADYIYTYEIKKNGEGVNIFSNVYNNSNTNISSGQPVMFYLMNGEEVIDEIEGVVIEEIGVNNIGSIDIVFANHLDNDFDRVEIRMKSNIGG